MKKMKTLLIMVFALLGITTGSECKANGNKEVEVVAPKEFEQRLNEDTTAVLLDVRRPDEYQAGHLKGAALMNWLDRKSFKKGAKSLDKSRTIYVYCRSGRRSNEAANFLAKKGFRVVDMQGGYLAWTEFETSKETVGISK